MRKLTILSTNVIKSGQGTKGPWTLRGVEALDERGEPIAQQLKTFSDLPNGEVEVEIEVQEHEKYGRSYLLKPARGAGGGGGSGSPSGLEQRVAALEAEVRRLSSIVDRREPGAPPPSNPAGPSPGIPDDDIPF